MPVSTSVLSEMDWDEGFSMPVANVENKKLEETVQQREKEIVRLQQELTVNDDRVRAITEHLKNVRQELHHTQGLVTARDKELETEDHLMKIAEREEGRLMQEITKTQKSIEELKEQKNIFENNIFKQTQKLEELKTQMNWDQQALEAWLEESAGKDEDAMTIQKYAKEDDAKIKELTLRLGKLTDEAALKKRKLDHETMETQTTQIELDKAAEEFRAVHAERQNLIRQWEQTIGQMQKRDQEMDLLSNDLAKLRSEVHQRENVIQEKKQFLESHEGENTEMNQKIHIAERTSVRLRLDYQEAETERVRFSNELDTLKRTVDRTSQDLESMRSNVSHLKRDIMDKQNRLREMQGVKENLNEKLKIATEAQLSAEELAAKMDEMMEDEEKRQREIEMDLKHLRDLKFKKSRELYTAKKAEKDTKAEIEGSHAAVRNLDSKIGQLDHDSLKQMEIIYNQDFAIQQVERRINRMQGEHSNEEKMALEAKIKDMNKTLEERQASQNLLTGQLKRLQDDIRRVNRDLEKSTAVKADLTVKIDELNLYNENSQRELTRLVESKQEVMVDDNLLKLEIKRLREIIYTKSSDVLSLEKRKLQLETAMCERRNEVKLHKDMLQAQVRAADDERQQISSELHERISKIDKLKKRYEILMVAMAPPEGEEERSQAYYVIRAAQEKEELQRTGDDLDAKIRKAEKEIRALENTLRLMNGRNETYRKSFNKVGESSEEMEEKEGLEEQHRAVMDKYKYKRRQIRELQEDLQTMSHTLASLQRDESVYGEVLEEKQQRMTQLQRELDEQGAKLERVGRQNTKYVKEVRTAASSKGEIPEEVDIEIRELREFNRVATQHIGEVASQYPEIAPIVHAYFQQADLPPPPSPGRPPGSHASSSRSLASSAPSSARSDTSMASSRRSSKMGVASVTAVDMSAQLGAVETRTPGRSPASSASSTQSKRRAAR